MPPLSCAHCGNEAEGNEIEGGDILCEECIQDETFSCHDCGNRFYTSDSTRIEDLDYLVCPGCLDNYFCCNTCGDYLSDEAREPDEEACRNCMREPEQEAPVNTKSSPGKIVKSTRRFGVELETVQTKSTGYMQLQRTSSNWSFTGDGSIRITKDGTNGIEMVSPILSQDVGEREIETICKEARKLGFFVNASCGFHLHLEAKDFKRNKSADKKEIQDTPEHEVWYEFMLNGGRGRARTPREVPRGLNSKPVIEEAKRESLIVNKGQEFYRLRDLWYVYIVFDDVFRGMQPYGRRHNRFCQATSNLYSLDTVRELEDYGELERRWYKTDRRYKLDRQIRDTDSRKNGKDDSRYCGFNLEPIIRNKGQTIEIRYHSPTLNPEKILRWVDIHQTIFDKVSQGNWSEGAVNNVIISETNLIKKAQAMCQIFGINRDTEKYIIERLEKFNDLKLSSIDEEVEPSEEGSPLHRSRTAPEPLRRGSDEILDRTFSMMADAARSTQGIVIDHQRIVIDQPNSI